MKDEREHKAQKDIATDAQPVAPPRKKKYNKPGVVYQAPLEALAATCTPTPPGKASAGAGCTFPLFS